MNFIIAVAWDTQYSPVDCRKATPAQYFSDDFDDFFVKFREKVEGEAEVEAIGTLSKRTGRMVHAYLSGLEDK